MEYFPERKGRYELVFEGPTSISGLLERLGVGRALVMAAIVDGKRRDFEYEPPDGAEVILITPPAGG
jgi:molybdopterin converting factor small subunit